MKNVFVMSFVDDYETVNKFDEFGFVCEIDDEVNGVWCCERDLSYLSEEEVINFIEKTLEDHTSLSSNVISNNSYDIQSEYVLLLDQLGNDNMINMLSMIIYIYLYDL